MNHDVQHADIMPIVRSLNNMNSGVLLAYKEIVREFFSHLLRKDPVKIGQRYEELFAFTDSLYEDPHNLYARKVGEICRSTGLLVLQSIERST